MTVLSVNINKVAVLRNSRGGDDPDPVQAAQVAIGAGCRSVTIHPRPDQRHITVADVGRVQQVLQGVEFNIEGNPFAAPHGSYPGFIELLRAHTPVQATLVPDDDTQITSNQGFDPVGDAARLAEPVRQLKALGCRVSVFVNAGEADLAPLADIGVDRVEIYTGPYAQAYHQGSWDAALADCVTTAAAARRAGLGINAGHDLDQRNLGTLKEAIDDLSEVSIGHALFGEAIYEGLHATVKRYLAILARS